MATIGRDFSSAATLIRGHQNEAFEVNKDGSIRRQTGLEKLLLLGTRLVGKYQKTQESKDAKVAVALQNLYQKQFQGKSTTVVAPNVNPAFGRYFGGPKTLDDRKAKQITKADLVGSKKASTSSKAAKEIKNPKGVHRIILNSSPANQGPRIPKNPKSIEAFEPPKGDETDQELRELADLNKGISPFIGKIYQKRPEDVTPAEFKWLSSGDKLDNLTARLSHYSPAEITAAKVTYNDALKLALREYASAEKVKGNHGAGSRIHDVVLKLEGNKGGHAGDPFDQDTLKDPKHVIDPTLTNRSLAEFGFKLGEGPLAKFKNAEYDYVQWAKANPVSLPPGESSPIRF